MLQWKTPSLLHWPKCQYCDLLKSSKRKAVFQNTVFSTYGDCEVTMQSVNILNISPIWCNYTKNSSGNAKNSGDETFHEIWYRWITMIIICSSENGFHHIVKWPVFGMKSSGNDCNRSDCSWKSYHNGAYIIFWLIWFHNMISVIPYNMFHITLCMIYTVQVVTHVICSISIL